MPGLFFDSGIDKTFEKDLERMNAAVNKFANNTEKSGKNVGQSFDNMTKKANIFQTTIGQLVKGFLAFNVVQSTIGFVKQAFADAFNTIKDFATGVSELTALTGLQGDDLQFLKDRAKDMGAQYGKSAREIVDAIKLVGSARPELLGNAEALSDMTDKVLILSRASGLDLQQSTEALTGALNQFNAPASEAGDYIDILASAAQKGSKEIPFLSDFILRTGKIAKDANITFKELVTTAELLGPSFKSPEVPATALNRILLNLQKAGLGYASGSFKLSDALNDVKNKLAGFKTESEKAAYQNEIFGEGITVGKILLEKSGKQFDEFEASIGKTGAALEQANERMNNLQGDIERGQGIWDKFVLSLDEGNGVLSKIARSFVQTKNGLISMLTAVNTEYGSSAEKAHELNKAAGETIPLWDLQIKTLGFLIPSLKNLREEGEKQFEQEKQFNKYLIEARKKRGLDEKGNRIKSPTIETPEETKTTGTATKNKEVLSYYDQLKKKLDEARKALEKLSGVNVDQTKVANQIILIDGLETQIKQQEDLLGLSKSEKETKEQTRKIEEGSLKFLEQKLSVAQENFEYATSPEARKVAKEETEELEKQINAIKNSTNNMVDFYEETIFVEDNTRKIGENIIGWSNELSYFADSISLINEDVGTTLKDIAGIGQSIGQSIIGISTGNPVQAVQGIASAIGQIFSIGKRRRARREAERLQAIEDRTVALLERQNDALTEQENILKDSTGLDRFQNTQTTLALILQQIKQIDNSSKDLFNSDDLQARREELVNEYQSLLQDTYQELTQTTAASITDSILDGFENGKLAAEDFADTFEELMRQSILQSFSTKFLESQFASFYDEFAKAAESGGELTAQEINSLKSDFQNKIAVASEGFKQIDSLFQSVFGEGLANTDSINNQSEDAKVSASAIAGTIQQSISEETGGILVGRIGTMVLSNEKLVSQGFDMLDYAVQNLVYQRAIKENTDYLPQIEQNTRRMYEKLDNI